MIGRGFSVIRTGLSVAMNALGLTALLAAAWLMPYLLESLVRVSGGQ